MFSIHNIFSNYFWAFALVICAVNYWRARRQLQQSSQLSERERCDGERYQRIVGLATALPWMLMGVATLSGATPTIWHYFRPQDGNYFVWAWFVSVFLLTCVYAVWLFFADGVKKVKHFHLGALLGFPSSNELSAGAIKISAIASVLMTPVWVFIAMQINFPLPI